MKRYILGVLVAITAAIAIAPTANASVLVSPPHRSMSTGSCITLGYWYQSYSGGSRSITAAVYRSGRRVTKFYNMTASTSWKYKYLLCPDRPGRYKTRIWTGGYSPSYPTHVTGEQDG